VRLATRPSSDAYIATVSDRDGRGADVEGAATFGGAGARQKEEAVKAVLSADLLRRWFGDTMLQQPIQVPDLARATFIDLLRILDYPSEFVPVVSRLATPLAATVATAQRKCGPIQVADKSA
jgi:hypothetical protein